MMLHSVKEMEDMAIRVLRKGLQRWGVTDALSRRLSQLREEQEGFFDSARAVRTLHRGWRSVVESEAITRQYFSGKHYHVVTL